jgi:hypothetical protein
MGNGSIFRSTPINVDDYGRGYDAGYTASLKARKPVQCPANLSALRGEDYAKGYNAGAVQYAADSVKE